MRLGELPQHPDFHRLLDELEKQLDKATDAVVGASSGDTVDRIRFHAGYRLHVKEMLDVLTNTKRKGG